MRKTTTLAAATAALGLGLVGLGFASQASAQTAPATPAMAPPAPAPAAVLTIDSPIGDLLDNPGAKSVLQKDMPKLLTYEGLDSIKSMSLRQISQYPQSELDDAKLQTLQTELAAATAPAK
jgi:para-nitrobenzyl esterase